MRHKRSNIPIVRVPKAQPAAPLACLPRTPVHYAVLGAAPPKKSSTPRNPKKAPSKPVADGRWGRGLALGPGPVLLWAWQLQGARFAEAAWWRRHGEFARPWCKAGCLIPFPLATIPGASSVPCPHAGG